jgi:hypothetical protein
MFRKFSPGFSRAVNRLLRSLRGIRPAEPGSVQPAHRKHPSEGGPFLAREGFQVEGFLIGRPEPIAHYQHLMAGLAGAHENIVGAR